MFETLNDSRSHPLAPVAQTSTFAGSRVVATLLGPLLTVLLLTAAAPAQTFEAAELRGPWLDRHGNLTVSESGLTFQTPKAEWSWEWTDVQLLDRVSPTRLDVLTYEDSAIRLGRDRRYRFELASELSDELWQTVRARFGRPVTDRAAAPAETPKLAVPVKRLRGWFGSEGRLVFLEDRIKYETDADTRARSWRFGKEIESVWSADPYQLEVHVREAGRRPEVYRFELKERLPAEVYRDLKLRLYGSGAQEGRLGMLE